MPYAVAYTRFSSKRQAKGSSLYRQDKYISAWLKKNPSYKLYPKQFKDLGISGYDGTHLQEQNGLGQLLSAIEHKEIKRGDVILVEALDRLGRLTPLKMMSLISQIIEAGIKIITVRDDCEYGPTVESEKIWMLLGKIQQSHAFSEELSGKISDSYEKRRYVAAAGKIPKRRTPIWLGSDGTLKPDVADAMSQAFEDALTGMGERRILRRLQSISTEFQKKNPSTVRKWLTNKVAIGYWGEYRIYPPIVSEELFYQVQRKFESEYKPASAPTKNFLSGLVKCGVCGSNMQVKANKNSPFSLNCSKRCKFGEQGCANDKSFPAPVLLHICNDTATPAVVQALKRIQLSQAKKQEIIIDGKLADIQKNIEALAKALQEVGLIPEIKNRLTKLQKERGELEDQKLLLARACDDETEQGDYEIAWDEQYKLLADDPMRLNAILQTVNYHLVCFPNGKIQSSTQVNDLRECQYLGYDRKNQTYKLQRADQIFRIENRDGTLSKERAKRFLKMLQQMRKQDTASESPLPKDEKHELHQLYTEINQSK